MKFKSFLILLFSVQIISAQSTLKLYPTPPSSEYNQMHNDDYSVRVRKPGGSWQDLYEYKTYVNSGSGPGSTRYEFEESSFVAFDFNGKIEIEVTSNWSFIENITLRPKSKNTVPLYHKNKAYFSLDEPSKISLEINGNRHRNLHVFANKLDSGPPANVTKIFEAGQVYTFPNNKYIPQNNEVIYIEGGAIIRGEIMIVEKKNIKILGRGIIDQTPFRKRYSKDAEFIPEYEGLYGIAIRRSSNIEIEGIIINDGQTYSVSTVNSNFLNFDNLKIFSRTLWGDGINMAATNNVTINDCFIRTADDCIAIYATRKRPWGQIEGNTTNINVSNSSLYADAARPIEIGWHGNQRLNYGNLIYNVNFNNIDILEHDEKHGPDQGVIAINCSDENRCLDFQFNNIRVEEFTLGRLLNIQVEPKGSGSAEENGKQVRNISFYNLSYNSDNRNGEVPSVIRGLNCERHVDGVHFQDFKVNGQLISNLSDPKIEFITNQYAYNITFQEATNFSKNVPTGIYRIKNRKTGKYLHNSEELSDNGISNYALSYTYKNSDRQKWRITNENNGRYTLTNLYNSRNLHNSRKIYRIDCKAKYIYSSEQESESYRQKWKIVGNNGYYKIINAYSRAYLHNSIESARNNPNGNYVVTSNENNLNSQDWELIRIPELEFKKIELSIPNDKSIIITPNPSKDYIQIYDSNKIINGSLKLIDVLGKVITLNNIDKSNSHYIGNIRDGIYFVFLEKKNESFFIGRLIKN